MSDTAPAPIDPEIEQRLAALEAASDRRRAELRALAAEVPVAISRRALVARAAKDLRDAPNKAEIARRAGRKLVRIPGALSRRIRR